MRGAVCVALGFTGACGSFARLGGADDVDARPGDPGQVDAQADARIDAMLDDTTLLSLSISSNGGAIVNRLTPVFDPAVESYAANVGLGLQAIQITAVAASPVATIKIAGADVASGSPSAPVALALGVTQITIVVDAPGATAHVYGLNVTRGGQIAQEAYVKASNPRMGGQFESIAMWGDTLAVSSTLEDSCATGIGGNETDHGCPGSGAVYLFVRDGSGWKQQAYIKASNTEAGDGFGGSVALYGNTLAVGATFEDGCGGGQSDNACTDAGAVYVFTRAGTTWTQQAYLKAPNAGAGDHFSGVSLWEDTLAARASHEASCAKGVGGDPADDGCPDAGAVYVFTRAGTTWTQQAYLKASNTDAYDNFGGSIALWGDTLAVATAAEDSAARGIDGDQTSNAASSSGAAYVFRRTGTTWAQEAYIKASNTEAGDYFGFFVALSGDTLAVGALFEQSCATGTDGDQASNVCDHSGAVYVFTRAGTTWTQQAYVKASNTEAYDWFSSVALWGDELVVGAKLEDSGAAGVGGDQTSNAATDSGAAYIFLRTGTTWAQAAYVKASNTGSIDQFGSALAIWGDTVAIIAPEEDSAASGVGGDQTSNAAANSGAAYVFR